MNYVYVKTPRSGLGNQLFVWARAIKFSKLNHATLLSPSFFKFKIGPILRCEKDFRFYGDLFVRHEKEIHGIPKFIILWRYPRISESDFYKETQKGGSENSQRLIVIERTKESFSELNGSHELIKSYLVNITRAKWLNNVQLLMPMDIGMHVRLGDISGHQRHPISWYIDAINFIRSIVDEVPVAVFSDGKDHELSLIMKLPNVRLVRTGSAIGDLLALSSCRFLIGNGCSSFSAWAAYLGQMPAFTRLGNSFSWFDLQNTHGHFIGEWDPAKPDDHLVREIKSLV